MKYFTILFLFTSLFFISDLKAQSIKIPFVEHFSNTKCPICQNNRSDIESDLDQFKGDINTMTIHRKYPYSSCPLYLYAKEEADNREAVFSKSSKPLSGTPSLCVNGEAGHYGSIIDRIEKAQDDEVLAGLNMVETGTNSKKVTLEVFNLSDDNMDNLFVYAALVQQRVDINVDGEDYTIHHVFRKFLGDQKGNGDPVSAIAPGKSETIVLEGTVPNDLSSSGLYVLAWVEQRVPNGNKYEIVTLNSVSKLTTTITSTELSIPESELSLYPNPATQQLHVRNTSDFTPDHYRILSVTGREIRTINGAAASIQISDLPDGQYILMLENENNRVSRKFLKQ